MSFLLRAALVIGVLSWLALQRQGGATLDPGAAVPKAGMPGAALAAWDALPAPAREAALRAGAAEAVRRMAGPPVSGDTLVEGDRTPGWRGP